MRRGVTGGPQLQRAARDYLEPVLAQDVDTLVLGCTHYPLLTGVISYVAGDGVTLVSSAEETAKDVYRTLVAHGLERDPAAPEPDAPVPGHRRPARLRAPGPALPRTGGRSGRHLGTVVDRSTSPRSTGRVRLTVVGCAGVVPGRDSAASCYLVEHDGHRILLDLGSGAFGALQQHVDPTPIDAVLLSHLHPDHCADLCGCYVSAGTGRAGSRPPACAGAGRVRCARRRDVRPARSARDALGIRLPRPRRRRRARPVPGADERVVHPVPAYAIRVEAGGRSLVYSGDTGATDALVELARGCDLALFEASFLSGRSNPPDLHLTAREAGDHARRAEAGRLVLTHLVAWNDPGASRAEAALAYGGDLTLAAPGASYDL